jgi:hypothetical protein
MGFKRDDYEIGTVNTPPAKRPNNTLPFFNRCQHSGNCLIPFTGDVYRTDFNYNLNYTNNNFHNGPSCNSGNTPGNPTNSISTCPIAHGSLGSSSLHRI